MKLSEIPGGGCPVRAKCVELSSKYKGNRLTFELAKYTADHWLSMYEYKPFTKGLPPVIRKYQLMSDAEKAKFNKEQPDWPDMIIEEKAVVILPQHLRASSMETTMAKIRH